MKISELRDKFELYILSLWLLFFLIIVVTVDVPVCFGEGCKFIGWELLITKNVMPLISLVLIASSVVLYFRFDYRISGSNGPSVKVTNIEDVNYEHLTFLTTYIIPLICFNLDSFRYIFALVLLLIVIGIIYVKTDKFYANPTLAVLGYRLYKVTVETRTKTQKNIIIITKTRVSEGDQIRMIKLDEKVCYARVA